MNRSIPVTHSGIIDHITLNDVKPEGASSYPQGYIQPAWTPPTERVQLSHHIEAPDHVKTRGWAAAFGLGGAILAAPLALMAVFYGATTGQWMQAGYCAFGTLIIPGVLFIAPLTVRFWLLSLFDIRTREAMPAPRAYAKATGKASHVIESRVIDHDRDPDRDAHLHKLYTLALWAASEERKENEDGEEVVTKRYGAAPLMRRGGKGRRELVVEATGEAITQEKQEPLHDELAEVGIFKLHSWGWGLYDVTWTREQVISRMEAAFPDD